MMPGVTIPSVVQVQPPPQPAALTALSADVAIGRLPFAAVGGSVAMAEVINQSQGNGQALARRQAAAAAATTLPSVTPPILGSSPSVGFSSLFIAQLLGQSSFADGDLIASFYAELPSSIALDNETLAQFSRVKYKPSYASLPPPPSAAQQAAAFDEPTPVDMLRTQLSTSPAAEKAVSVQSERAAVTRLTNELPVQSSTITAQATASSLPVQVRPAPKANYTPVRSLVQNNGGIDAYFATLSRNSRNLKPIQPKSLELAL